MIKRVAREIARGLRARRPIYRGVRILTYHGVIEERTDRRVDANFHLISEFREHIKMLEKCRVVSLAELDDALDRRWPAVAITFDDGFRNNLIAAELLDAARLPATIFVATQNVEHHEPIWPTLLRLLLARGSARVVHLGGVTYDLDGDDTAFARVRKMFKDLPADERAKRWGELVAQLRVGEVDELLAGFPSIEMMTWGEARTLPRNIEIGSHGLLHELHHAQQSPAIRETELRQSREQIERALGRSCRTFAFPNGTFMDASGPEVRAAGYTHGFTMVSRAATRRDDPMLLPRLMPGPGGEKLVASVVFGN